MTTKWLVATGLAVLLAAPLTLAQGGRQGASSPGQARAGSMGQSGQQARGLASQRGQQNRDQARMRTTPQQQDHYRDCTQSMERVRAQIREMQSLTKSHPINLQQARQTRERLQNEIQTMGQVREQLAGSLVNNQNDTVQTRLQQVRRHQQRLEEFSEALGFELDQTSMDQDRVRDRIRDLDQTSKQLQDQDRALGEALSIE